MIDINGVDFQLFLTILGLLLIANYLLFKNLLFSWVDPIWFFVIVNSTVTLTLVIYDRFINDDFWVIVYVILCQLFFILGAYLTKWIVTSKARHLATRKAPKEDVTESRSALWLSLIHI